MDGTVGWHIYYDNQTCIEAKIGNIKDKSNLSAESI